MGSSLRLVGLVSAVSLASDVGTGQPMEHGLRTAVLGVMAAKSLAVSAEERSSVLYTALLRFLGCTAEASSSAVLAGGDEIAFNAMMAPVVMADDREAVPHLLRHLGEGLPVARRVGRMTAALSDPGGKARTLSAHCEVGARLAGRMGLPDSVVAAVAHGYERWDGKGIPDGLSGEDIPLSTRIAVVARDVDVWHRQAGWEETVDMLRRRSGRAYDPAVVDAFTADGAAFLAEIDREDPWELVQAFEPDPVITIDGGDVDAVLVAVGDFADLKSPWFTGHSRAVSELAGAAAQQCGSSEAELVRARRAGLVHDLGVVGVPAGVWNRPGPLTSAGWERARLHPLVGERILSRCPALADLAGDVGAHHERLDGSGYHRGSREVPLGAQLVAAADVYQALSEDRPHRQALNRDDAAGILSGEADAGRFSRRAVDAVLAAAGHTSRIPQVGRPAGLTEREVDVLRLVARGRSNKQVAAELGISAKTVGSHIEHIYTKAGVATRAGATVFAMENDLLRP